MANSIAINPSLTTNAAGTFNTQSLGFVQGCAMPDPATRFALAGGWLDNNEALPMWGGTLITENLAAATVNDAIGNPVARATSIVNATGMSVFDQAYGMINTPQSPVPLALGGMSINFYRFGSGARIPVACDPILVSLLGGNINQQVSWDFTGQQLVQYNALDAQIAITTMVWSAGVVTLTSAAPHGRSVGDWITISGAAPVAYNGDYQVQSVADSTHLTFVKAVNPGAIATPGVILAGGGALPCKILEFRPNNCKTVLYDPATNFATWNPNGACALIQI